MSNIDNTTDAYAEPDTSFGGAFTNMRRRLVAKNEGPAGRRGDGDLFVSSPRFHNQPSASAASVINSPLISSSELRLRQVARQLLGQRGDVSQPAVPQMAGNGQTLSTSAVPTGMPSIPQPQGQLNPPATMPPTYTYCQVIRPLIQHPGLAIHPLHPTTLELFDYTTIRNPDPSRFNTYTVESPKGKGTQNRAQGWNIDFGDVTPHMVVLPNCVLGAIEYLDYFPNHSAHWQKFKRRLRDAGWNADTIAEVKLFARSRLNPESKKCHAGAVRQQSCVPRRLRTSRSVCPASRATSPRSTSRERSRSSMPSSPTLATA
jgi:hypothetical protein